MRYVPRITANNTPTGSLCWYCQNSVPSPKKKTGCSWSRAFQPVYGWTAIPLKQLNQKASGTYDTFCVLKCPQYLEEPMRYIENDIEYREHYGRLAWDDEEDAV